MLKFSRRASSMIASPIRKYLPHAQAAVKRGIKVFALNIGQPDLPAPLAFWKEVSKWRKGVLAYAPSTGEVSVQDAWSRYFQSRGIPLQPRDVLVTTGGSEAIFFSLGVVTDPGDEVIVFEPSYSSYKSYAGILNITLVPVTLKPETCYHLPRRQEIEKKVTKRTRAIVIINPNNPTGAVYTRVELASVAAIARKYKLWIIADETYRDLVFEGKKSVSIYEIPGIAQQVILTDSMSKRFNLCGARIGCLASTSQEVIANALKLAQARLSSPTIEQFAVIPLLSGSQKYLEGIRREYKRRRDVVYGALMKMPGVKVHRPEGAFYLMATLPVKNAEDFIKFMLGEFSWQRKTTFVTPGEDFYLTKAKGRNEVRIAYVLNTKDLQVAMEVLQRGLKAYTLRWY
ncbi:MAG: pyridoxal phosphate-dependent aminotransferase [Patescibacteria group bacterium]